jgi:hypothetical protein
MTLLLIGMFVGSIAGWSMKKNVAIKRETAKQKLVDLVDRARESSHFFVGTMAISHNLRVHAPPSNTTLHGSTPGVRDVFGRPDAQQQVSLPCFDPEVRPERQRTVRSLLAKRVPIIQRLPVWPFGPRSYSHGAAKHIGQHVYSLGACLSRTQKLCVRNALTVLFRRVLLSDRNETIGVHDPRKIGQSKFVHPVIVSLCAVRWSIR